MTKTQQQKVQTLFGDEIDFSLYCFACGQKPPKEKDTRPEIEKQDIYTVSDDEITEMVCARSHGHARSIYLSLIGEYGNFTGIKLSIKKHSILKSLVTENSLGSIVDAYDADIVKKLYNAGAYVVQYFCNEKDELVEKQVSLEDALCEKYNDESFYWSIPKAKKVWKKNKKKE